MNPAAICCRIVDYRRWIMKWPDPRVTHSLQFQNQWVSRIAHIICGFQSRNYLSAMVLYQNNRACPLTRLLPGTGQAKSFPEALIRILYAMHVPVHCLFACTVSRFWWYPSGCWPFVLQWGNGLGRATRRFLMPYRLMVPVFFLPNCRERGFALGLPALAPMRRFLRWSRKV